MPLIPIVIVGSLLLAAGVLKLLVPSESPEADPSQACACGQVAAPVAVEVVDP